MFVDIIDNFCEIKEKPFNDFMIHETLTLTRVKIDSGKIPNGFAVKEKITEVFGECGGFYFNEIPGGFVFSYIEDYPEGADEHTVFPEERHVYQGLLKVFDIIL